MMKTLRILSLAAALLGLSGCPSSPVCTVGVGHSSNSQTVGLVVMGEQVRLKVPPSTEAVCEPGAETPVPLSVSAEVYGPDNLLVPSEATLGSPSTSSATVTFTPNKQGRYHVLAAFEPVGGTPQLDLYSARDRSAEAPAQTLPEPICRSVERTQKGGWLCDTDFVRNGAVVQNLSGFRLAVSGDVVWAVSPSRVQRYVDTGTALELTASMIQSEGSALFLLPSANELVVLYGTTLQRITFDGSALASTGPTSWTPGTHSLGPEGLQALLLRTGDQLATVSASLVNNTFVVLSVCPYQLVTGRFARTTASCQSLTTEVVGFEPSALWTGAKPTFGEFFSELRRQEWSGTALVDRAALPLGDTTSMKTVWADSRNTAIPALLPFPLAVVNTTSRAFMPVYSPSQGGIVLEALETAVDTRQQAPSISPALLWGPSPTGSEGVRVRIRPSAP